MAATEPLNIDVAGANDALDEAGGMPTEVPSTGPDPFHREPDGRFASKPEESTTPVAEAPEAPEAPAATPPAETAEEAPSFTHIDDSALSPELLQMKRSLQADYTRKTQEIAPWRKLGEELEVDAPEDFRDALEVYTRLQDPRNWPTIHRELSEYMEQYGMTPAQAREAAATQLSELAPAEPEDDPYEGLAFDPDGEGSELAPLLQKMKRQDTQINELKQLIVGERERAENAAQVQQLAEHLTRQETQIRGQNPQYEEDDIEAIYNMMGEDGNLVAAQQRYESVIGARVAKWITSKQTAQHGTPVVAPGAGVTPAEEAEAPVDMDAAHKAALAHVAELERQEATS